MDVRGVATGILIAVIAAAALYIDIAALPPGDRAEFPNVPLVFFAIALMLVAGALAHTLRSAKAAFFTALALTTLTVVTPLLAYAEGADGSIMLLRRSPVVLTYWLFAITALFKRQIRSMARKSEATTAAFGELQHQHRQQAQTLKTIADRDRELQSKLETEVQTLNERLRGLARVAFDAIVVTENDVIIDVTLDAADNLGYTPQELIGKTTLEFVPKQFHATAHRTRELEQTERATEMGLLAKDGSIAHIEYFATNLRSNGRTLRVIGIRDIERRVVNERALAQAAEAERQRIGFDLHDHVSQLLVGSKWAAERLIDRLSSDGQKDAAAQADNLAELIAESISEVRRVSSRLAPRTINSADIRPALEALCKEVELRHPRIKCRLVDEANQPLPNEDSAIHLFRIAEEAVTIAAHHSGVREIQVRLSRIGDDYQLTVTYDGSASVLSSPDGHRSVGVRSMQHRARMLDGVVDFGTTPSGANQVSCNFHVLERRAVSGV